MSIRFGKIAQIGYVVRDIDAAMDNWVRHGVGPWFYVDRVQTDFFRYRGVDSDMQMSVALANSGDVQLELIKLQRCPVDVQGLPRRRTRRNATHRLLVRRLPEPPRQRSRKRVRDRAGRQYRRSTGRFAYLDTEVEQGTVIELSDISGPKGQLFQYIRDVAASWDGGDWIRGRE